MSMSVTSLHVYPLKGCHGTDLTGATVTPRGFRHDRELMLVDPKSELITGGFGNDQVAVMDRIECTTEETDCCHARFPCVPGRSPGSTV